MTLVRVQLILDDFVSPDAQQVFQHLSVLFVDKQLFFSGLLRGLLVDAPP